MRALYSQIHAQLLPVRGDSAQTAIWIRVQGEWGFILNLFTLISELRGASTWSGLHM